MFTGLIEDVGIIQNLEKREGGGVLTVTSRLPLDEVRLGDSIAVNGACLTVTAMHGQVFTADASPETLQCTTLGSVSGAVRVNLERALRLGDRLGGHLVTGHVDSVAEVSSRTRQGNMEVFRFRLDSHSLRLLVAKGSVAIDGISLTVNSVDSDSFSVAIIPHTLKNTTLVERRVGDAVNIETDLLGKYVARLLETRETSAERPGMDVDFLAKHGFV